MTVEVGLFSWKGSRGFYVADDGDGFSSADTDAAFESVYSTTDDQSELGLAIVRRIAGGHEWTISVTESWTEGARIEIADVDVASERSPAVDHES